MSAQGIVEASAPKRRVPVALIITMVVAAILGAGSGFGATNIPFLLGNVLPLSALAWAILHFAVLKPRGDRQGWRSFILVYASAFVAGLMVMQLKEREMIKARSGVLSSFEQLVSGSRDVNTTRTASGEAGALEEHLKNFFSTVANDRRDYDAELTALDIENIFTPENLRADPQLTETKFRVRRAAAIAEKYTALAERRVQDFRAGTAAIQTTEDTKRSLLEGIDQGEVKHGPRRRRVWELERLMLGEVEKAVTLLSSEQWSFEGDQIAFQDERKAEVYNGYMTNMNRYAKESETLTVDLQNQLGEALRGEAAS